MIHGFPCGAVWPPCGCLSVRSHLTPFIHQLVFLLLSHNICLPVFLCLFSKLIDRCQTGVLVSFLSQPVSSCPETHSLMYFAICPNNNLLYSHISICSGHGICCFTTQMLKLATYHYEIVSICHDSPPI